MAQLNDLIVAGASRLLNGLGVLGNANMDSIFPNITETYDLGSSDKKWKTGYIKSISANDMTLAILTVTNYATIGGGQAATAANTGALRVKGGLSTEQQSYFKGGAIFYGATDSSNRIYVFGDKTAQHISMGDAGIQAYSNNTPTASKLYLQYNGGDLDVGKSGHTGVTTIYGPFNYAGFSAASDNVDRVVWFSYNGTIGRPVYDNDFKYNPSTNRLTLGRLYLTNTEALSHIQFSRVGYNYVITPSGGSIAFGVKGSTNGPGSSLVVQGNQVIPGENNGTIDLGAPDYAWKSLYVRDLYLDDGNGKQNAHTSYTNGTASTTEGTNGTQGYFNLYLGNSTAISSTAGSGAGNSRGRLYIYGTGAYSSLIQSSAASSSKTVTIPNYTGNMVIGNNGYTNPTSATTYYMPFYLTEHKRTSSNDGFRYRTLEGTVDAVGYGGIYLGNSVASGTAANKYGFIRLYAKNSDYTTILSQGNGDRNFYLPNYAGDMYAIHASDNNAVGAGDKPVYVAANGRVTAFSSTIGGSTRPVYVNAGTVTPITAVGTAYGGTGNTSFTSGTLIYASSATQLSSNTSATTSGSTITLTNTGESDCIFKSANGNGAVELLASTNRGLYDRTLARWIIYTRVSDNTTRVPTTLNVDGNIVLTNTLGSTTTLYLDGAASCSTIFRTGGTERMRINPSGMLSINTTSTQSNYRLYVNGNAAIAKTSAGWYLMDSTSTNYPGVYDNGSNLWIGSTATAARHHRGATYISSGHNGTSGNSTVNICVPNAANDNGTSYGILHTGNYTSTLDGRYAQRTTWDAVIKGATWSRICYVAAHASVSGLNGILSVKWTRNSVVANAVFSIVSLHTSGYSRITQLTSGPYTQFQIRTVNDSNGNMYIEIYDNAQSISTSTTQSVTCSWIPLLAGAITKYTSFTSGASIPSGFSAGTSLTTAEGLKAPKVHGAVWNDYAEFRHTKHTILPGHVVVETGHGDLVMSTKRLQPGGNIVSDTFGFAIGETKECKTPIAVSGRVLAYPYEERWEYEPGDAVCTGPCGTVSKMTREEIREYPERIIGTVSEIPEYDTWGEDNVEVNGRIWIKVH